MPTLVSNGSAADVQAKLSAALDGDIVTIPAGTFTWASSVTCSKGVTLKGAGSANSTIVWTPNNQAIRFNSGVSAGARLTGLKFSGMTASNWCVEFQAPDGSNAPFEVDNCLFDGGSTPSVVFIKVFGGLCPGVIDHCTFNGGGGSEMIHHESYGAGSTTGWQNDVTPGGPQALYIENCIFNMLPGVDYQYGTSAVQSYYGARTVFRYNQMNFCQLDQHGTAGNVGARWWEVYNNNLFIPATSASACNFLNMRAGTGVIFNNVMSGFASQGAWLNLTEEDSGYPALYQIGQGLMVGATQHLSPAYLWNNDPNFILSSSTNVVVNRDYFSSPTQPPSMVRWQKSTDNGSTTYNYSPYTYPHPLIAANAAAGGGSLATTLERASFANLKYGRTNLKVLDPSLITVGQVLTITTANGTMTGTVKKFCGSTSLKLGDLAFNRPSSFLLLPKGSAIA